jgi:HK97 gp10 family phage protein
MPAVAAKLDVRGLKELTATFNNLAKDVRGPILRASLTAGGEVLKTTAVARIHSVTGQTAGDIRLVVSTSEHEDGGAAMVGGTKRAYILRFLEFGTKPHEIPRPKGGRRRGGRARRKARVFMTRAGQIYGARVPRHPGIRPQAPLTSALADATPQILSTFSQTYWDGIVATVAASPKAD